MIVVIDSSVWISALQFGGNYTAPIQAVEKALRNDTLATTPLLNAEIQRTLVQKFRWSVADTRRIVDAYFKNAIHVDITGKLRICRDPNDDMIVECAMKANAQLIISGDKDLLSLGSYCGIRIVSPAEYLATRA